MPIRKVVAHRLAHAYPVYSQGFDAHFRRLDEWVSGLDGVVSLGRQGLFAHDNTHHALSMAYSASECVTEHGEWNRKRWSECRRQFESHVVED